MLSFFRNHKKISGSVSIFLALLLLPVYSAIAMMIESARYRSAQEQLGELTYLGQLAILADYVDFLANDYGLYAYHSKDTNSVRSSFEQFSRKVSSAGGVDTRKLNTLFGIDMEQCEIQNMYSLADPKVLAYQIRQHGKYALPVSVINEVVLSDLFKEIGKKLNTMAESLGFVKDCVGIVANATGTIKWFIDVDDRREVLEDAIWDVDFYSEECRKYQNTLKNSDLDSIDYEMLLNWLNNGKGDNETNDEFSDLYKFVVGYEEYYFMVGELKTKYDTYCGSIEEMVNELSGMVQSLAAANEAEQKMKAAIDLNRSSVEELAQEKDKLINNESTEKAVDEKEREKLEYAKALQYEDYSGIGKNLVAKFVGEMGKSKTHEWKENFDAKYNAEQAQNAEGLPNPNFDQMNAEQLKEFVTKIMDVDYNEEYIEEFDFYSIYNSSLDNADEYTDNIRSYINDLGSDNKKDKKNADSKITKEKLQIIYAPLTSQIGNLSDFSSDWFIFDSDKSYYFSQETIIMFIAFYLSAASFAGKYGITDIANTLQKLYDLFNGLMPNDYALNNHIGSKTKQENIGDIPDWFPSKGKFYVNYEVQTENDPLQREKSIRAASAGYVKAAVKGKSEVSLEDYYIVKEYSPSHFDNHQPGQAIVTAADKVSSLISLLADLIEYLLKGNIWACKDVIIQICKENLLISYLEALILYCKDMYTIVQQVIEDIKMQGHTILDYYLDQLYIGYYINTHFTNRQNAKEYDGSLCDGSKKNRCEDNECEDGKNIFDGAEMEYILKGSPCELTNQHAAYYMILMIRFLLDFPAASISDLGRAIAEIPFAGPVLLVLAVIFEANVDMMFLVNGVKVPVIKIQSIYSINGLTKSVEDLNNILKSIGTTNLKTEKRKAQDGTEYTKYSINTKSTGEQIENSIKKNLGYDEEENKKSSGGSGGFISLDYGWYINLLMLTYNENTKLGRICDLLQMHGIEKKNKDFRIEDCYTYVYADIRAEYDPLLPMISGGKRSFFPDVRSVQLNGY